MKSELDPELNRDLQSLRILAASLVQAEAIQDRRLDELESMLKAVRDITRELISKSYYY